MRRRPHGDAARPAGAAGCWSSTGPPSRATPVSTHILHPPGSGRPRALGAARRGRATGCPPIHTVLFDFGPFATVRQPPGSPTPRTPICIRRTVLDKLLIDAAAEAGRRGAPGLHVKELLWEDGRVVGIRGRETGGRRYEERAAGDRRRRHQLLRRPARGRRSTTTSGPAAGDQRLRLLARTCRSTDRIELYTRPSRFFVALPTNDDLSLVISIWPHGRSRRATRAASRPPSLRRSTRSRTSPARVNAGQRDERFRGPPSCQGFFRQAGGPGWALVGDAGYHKDSITGTGDDRRLPGRRAAVPRPLPRPWGAAARSRTRWPTTSPPATSRSPACTT